MRTARFKLVGKSDELMAEIAAILFEEDPLGISIGFNNDEYESEAGTILPRLREASCAQDVEDMVYKEFCGWFGIEEAGPRERYRGTAARIWNAWRRHATDRTIPPTSLPTGNRDAVR